jgi:hypothetical protein
VLVLLKVVSTIKEKRELIIVVVREAEDAHYAKVELIKVSEVRTIMLLNLQCGFIGNAQWITTHEVFDLHKIYQVLQKGLFKGQLCFLENVILV